MAVGGIVAGTDRDDYQRLKWNITIEMGASMDITVSFPICCSGTSEPSVGGYNGTRHPTDDAGRWRPNPRHRNRGRRR